jgi:hypothetical protein
MASTRRKSTEARTSVEEPNDTPERSDLPVITSSTLAYPGGTPHVTRSTNHFVAVIGQHQSTNAGARATHSRQIFITSEILFARNSYG